MDTWKESGNYAVPYRDQRKISRLNNLFTIVLLLAGSLLVSYLLMERIGANLFLMAVVGIFFGTLYTVVSFANLMVPFSFFMVAVCGFKFLWSIRAPLLPDLYLDRMALVWLTVVFFVKFFAERRRLRPPFVLDILLFSLALYILVDIFIHGMFPFNSWTMSYVVPFATFFFAKNLITTPQRIRGLLLLLLVLTVYYSFTSIAEKLNLDFLIWPKYVLTNAEFQGRSNGPFGHAPLFGTVIGMLLPVHFYFISTTSRRLVKGLLYASLLAGFAGLYFTYTRGAWLAGFASLVTAAVLNRQHYLRIMMPAVVVAPILAIGFLGIGQDKFMKERVENQDTIGSRFGTWVTALKVWQDNPLFGVGFYNYRTELMDYVQPLDLPIIGTIEVSKFRNNPPHDIYISFLSETGLVGVSLQGSIYLIILLTFRRKFGWRDRGSHFATYVMPVFGGIFAGYLAGGLAIDYKFFSVVGAIFYGCAGILYGLRPEDEDQAGVENPDPVHHLGRERRFPEPLSHPYSRTD